MITSVTGQELVSIVIPLYNKSRYIEECLQSCVNQTYKHIELIIVDDCSTDNSVQKAKAFLKWKKIKYSIVQQSRNQGVSAARNRGGARGKWKVYLVLGCG